VRPWAVARVSTRLERRIRTDFPHHPNVVIAALTELTSEVFTGEPRDALGIERIQLAALILAKGNLRRLDDALVLGKTDWRDLLVSAGLANEGWQERVNAELEAPPAKHIW